MASNRGRRGVAWQRYRALVFARHTVNGVASCQICGGPVDMAEPYRRGRKVNPEAPTLQHVVALEHGGGLLDVANGAVAHLRCNSSEGARIRNGKHRPNRHAGTAVNSRRW